MKKKVLHISTSDKGGAGKACLRLHTGLLSNGFSSKMLVLDKFTNDIDGVFQFDEFKNQGKAGKAWNFFKRHIKPSIDEYKLRGKAGGFEQFSFPGSLFDITKHHLYKEADIIHLHFIPQFLDYRSFFRKNNKPVVWTLHDMNPFTGGCHYSAGCQKYQDMCRDCPQLSGTGNDNYSQKILKIKEQAAKNQKFQVVSPSAWLYRKAISSKVFSNSSHSVIPHGIDTNLFKPHDKGFSRHLFGLPFNKKIILFVADDFRRSNKGADILEKALFQIKNKDDVLLITAGYKYKIKIDFENQKHLGFNEDERLMGLLYSAADITVVPSREEAFSLITLESLAFGTPVVAFNNCGPSEIIEHGNCGWLAEAHSHESLRNGIENLLSDYQKLTEMSKAARERVVRNYSSDKLIKEYILIYER